MSDKWSKLRLFSVHDNLKDDLGNLRSSLLRFGYLIKANLPMEYQKFVIHVTYSLHETIHKGNSGVSVVLHFDKTQDGECPTLDVVDMINELTGTQVTVFEDTDTDLLIYVGVE